MKKKTLIMIKYNIHIDKNYILLDTTGILNTHENFKIISDKKMPVTYNIINGRKRDISV